MDSKSPTPTSTYCLSELQTVKGTDCTWWKGALEALATGSALQHVELSGRQSWASDAALYAVTKASPQLQYLDLSECSRLTDKTAWAIVPHCILQLT